MTAAGTARIDGILEEALAATGVPSDWKGRISALTPRRSFIVKAPAGSGKTELLTARFLSLLAAGGSAGGACPPSQILAVTFTDKAALEMRARIALWLARAKDGAYRPSGEWEKVVLLLAKAAWEAHGDAEALLLNPTAYRIQTFHGFCSAICRAWPIESGVPVNADILEDFRQERVLEEAVAALLRDLAHRETGGELAEAFGRRLAARNNRPRAVMGQLVALLKDRLRMEEFAEACGEGGEEALDRYFETKMAPCRDHFANNPEGWNALSAALIAKPQKGVDAFPEEIPSGGLESFPTWKQVAIACLTSGNSPAPRKERATAWKAATAFLAELPAPCVEALAFCRKLEVEAAGFAVDRQALQDYLLLGQAALAHLAPLIPGEGLDYTELEVGAARALKNARQQGLPSRSLVFCHDHLRHILVDESQDMNPFQLDLLGLLTDSRESDSPEATRFTPPTLFIVGDPKQSIYRFRGAEVALFDEVAQRGVPRLGQEPLTLGEPVLLTANFRSAPPLVEFANALFRRVLGTPRPGNPYDEVAHGDGESAGKRTACDPALRLATFHKAADGEAPDSQREAAWVAREVANRYREILSDPGRKNETVGILLPRRTQLDRYLSALRAEGVPVRLVEGETLSLKPEVLHLHTLFQALARPFDDVAWAGALRAPWCRVDEPTLYALARAREGRGNWRERIFASELPEVQRFCAALERATADFGREPFDATLQRVWEELGGPEATAARYGTAGVSNVFAYLRLLADCGGMPSEEALQLVDERLEKAYTPPDPAAATSPVQLMTVHKAKGLEFDHLFAVFLGYSPSQGNRSPKPPFLLLGLPGDEGDRTHCAATEPDSREAGKSLPYELLSELDQKRNLSEVKRLFYVAVTRAKRSLTLSGQVSQEKEGDGWKAGKGSPMALLREAAFDGEELRPEFGGLELLTDPEPAPAAGRVEESPAPTLPAAEALAAFPLPYVTKSPSEKLDPEEDQAKAGGEDERAAKGDGTAPILGKVVHRLLEKLARDGEGAALPGASSVAAALRTEGLGEAQAETLAPKLLDEARAAWDDPEFVALREGGTLLPEWGLEHFAPAEGGGLPTLLTGRLDLVIEKPGEVFLLDYKTSRRPEGVDPSAFRAEIEGRYKPQLARYEEMLRALPAFRGKAVKSHLLLTDFPHGRLL